MRARRLRRAMPGAGLSLLAIAAATWTVRQPIAEGFIDNALAARGIQASYQIETLGLTRQVLRHVVIGDPTQPDLTADWVEVAMRYGLSGPEIAEIRAGPVRLNGAIRDGKLSLGALDRLMPAPSGKPFEIPGMRVDLADARMRLATPQGIVGLQLVGKGRLDDGFAGRLIAVSRGLTLGTCRIDGVQARLSVQVADRRPGATGPILAETARCGDMTGRRLAADVTASVSEALDRWTGRVRLGLGEGHAPQGRISGVQGQASFAGTAARTQGTVNLQSRGFAISEISGGALAVNGRYGFDGKPSFDGVVAMREARLSRALLARLTRLGDSAPGTPVAPLLAKAGRGLAQAGQQMDASATLRFDGARLNVARLALAGRGGGWASLEGIGYDARGLSVNGTLATGGGGLPEAKLHILRGKDGLLRGGGAVRPYAANGAELALAGIRFSGRPDDLRFGAQVALSGPLAGGRIDGLAAPIAGMWRRGLLTLNPDCFDARFQRLTLSSLKLDPARLRLCPLDGATVRMGGKGVSGGVRTGALRIAGTLGSAPLSVAASGTSYVLADNRFALRDVAARLGVVKLDAAALSGQVRKGGVAGSFAGASGVIGQVPLRLSDGDGDWSFLGAKLAVNARGRVSDTAVPARFEPLATDDLKLVLADNRIDATATLRTPGDGIKVTDVTIAHNLSDGSGEARLAVPGISFAPGGFQPDRLTKLTFGVIAEVNGTLRGDGVIRWNRDGVTSGGTFQTSGLDFAAAFGPVTGLAGEIKFDDLLGLSTAPGQVATIASVNPGIPVEGGTVRYRLLPGLKVQVEGGRWPFAGGELVLDPTVMDFSSPQERRMTFRVIGVDAAQFLQEFDFDNLNSTGTFDGVLPMVFDANGGRIEGGSLTVREGGGTIAYVGEVTKRDVGVWGNMAFQALRSLRYRSLKLDLNGPLAGEMVTQISFAGISQAEGAKRNFLFDRLQKLPFQFNVTVRAPFRQLVDSVQSYYDPRRLIERNLPALIEEQKRREQGAGQPPAPAQNSGVQPPESGTMR